MAKPAQTVDDYLASLQHPAKDVLQTLRILVQEAVPDLQESVKWNAPSFALAGSHLVTLNLSHKTLVRIVLHGSTVAAAQAVAALDPAGQIQWAAPDRGILAFSTVSDVQDRAATLQAMIKRWVAAG